MPTRTARTGWTGTLEEGVGKVELTMRYGGPGRPEHRYRLIAGRELAPAPSNTVL